MAYLWKYFYLFLIVFTVVMPSVVSLSLSSERLLNPIIYIPGGTVQNHYEISDTQYEVIVSVGGDMAGYVTLSKIADNQFDMALSFPSKLIEAGEHRFSIHAQELPKGQSGSILSSIAVKKSYQVLVYSYKKDIAVALSANNANVNGLVNFELGINSLTYSDIDAVKAQIKVYDNKNKTVAT